MNEGIKVGFRALSWVNLNELVIRPIQTPSKFPAKLAFFYREFFAAFAFSHISIYTTNQLEIQAKGLRPSISSIAGIAIVFVWLVVVFMETVATTITSKRIFFPRQFDHETFALIIEWGLVHYKTRLFFDTLKTIQTIQRIHFELYPP